MNLHQWAPSQVHVRQYECPVDSEDPLSKSRLAPEKSKHLLAKPEVQFRIQMGPDSIGQYRYYMRIRILILLLIKVMVICDHWSVDLPRHLF